MMLLAYDEGRKTASRKNESAEDRAYRRWYVRLEAANEEEESGIRCTEERPIHQNGRVYDPTIARFLTADPIIQAPNNLQSYNRYSYVINNPLRYHDPSGYIFKSIKKAFKSIGRAVKKHWKTIVAVGLAAWGGWALYGTMMKGALAAGPITKGAYMAASIKAGAAAGAASGAIMGSTSTALNGGNLRQVLKSGATGAAYGAVTGAMFGGINGHYGNSWAAGRAVSNGLAGGASSEISGGRFRDGFKYAFTIASLKALHYGRNALNNGASDIQTAEQTMKELPQNESVLHANDVDPDFAQGYFDNNKEHYVRKFVDKSPLFSSESVFHGGSLITDGLNGGTWNVTAFTGWDSFKTLNPASWAVGATTLVGHSLFDVVPYGLWGNNGHYAPAYASALDYDFRYRRARL